jgi:hypothetical protein
MIMLHEGCFSGYFFNTHVLSEGYFGCRAFTIVADTGLRIKCHQSLE